MFRSNTDALLREIDDVGKRLRLSNERIVAVENERDEIAKQLEEATAYIEELKGQNQQLAAVVASQTKQADAERLIKTAEHTVAVVRNLVIAAESQGQSFELEQAVTAALEWLETRNPE
jgi:hypothetical protein